MRLFVGIDPPDAVKDRLLALQGGVSGARWQKRDQLHLTIRFIGELDRHQAEDVAAALAGLHHPRFDLLLDQGGVFGKPAKPDTLWIGVSPRKAVEILHNKVDNALRAVGIAPEQRQYLPHITLARLNHRVGPLHGFLETGPGPANPAFPVDDFCLYRSTLGHDGAVYDILERYPLD
jgi:RNA 2',3'-cyclic 3'-phosphodiesterase